MTYLPQQSTCLHNNLLGGDRYNFCMPNFSCGGGWLPSPLGQPYSFGPVPVCGSDGPPSPHTPSVAAGYGHAWLWNRLPHDCPTCAACGFGSGLGQGALSRYVFWTRHIYRLASQKLSKWLARLQLEAPIDNPCEALDKTHTPPQL